MEYDNINKGVLFVNDRKKSDNHPDYKGRVNIGGVDYWLAGWWKQPKKGGDDFLSLSVGEEIEDDSHSNPPAPAPAPRAPARKTTNRGSPRQSR